MRFSQLKFVVFLALTILLSACSSTPQSNFYLLSAPASELPLGQSPSVGIGPVEIPEYLNRNGLVYNRDGTRLHIASYERWAEPLASGVERVLGLNLSHMLATDDLQSFPWLRSEAPQYAVQVSIVSLDASDGSATLIAEWAIQKPQDNTLLTRKLAQLKYTLPTAAVTPDQIPPAYSKLIEMLSAQIAARIRQDIDSGNDS